VAAALIDGNGLAGIGVEGQSSLVHGSVYISSHFGVWRLGLLSHFYASDLASPSFKVTDILKGMETELTVR
jgi:hypothetical protein